MRLEAQQLARSFMSKLRSIAVAAAIVLLGVVAIVALWLTTTPGNSLSANAAGGPNPRITISPETTYIIEPLRADGYVDYVAALNQRMSQGVTPENNAAVLLLKAMGPATIPESNRARYFELLGIAPLPIEGNYFVEVEAYANRLNSDQDAAVDKDALSSARDEAMSRPWTKDEFPEIAGWLAANETPLKLIVEASKRPRRFDPLLSTTAPPTLIETSMMAIQLHREAARVLTARAMLKLGEGKTDEAWDNLLAGHRLARLSGQGALLVDMLVAMALDAIAAEGDRVLLAQGNLTAAQARRMYDDLHKLGPLPRSADTFDFGERFIFLDFVQTCAAKGLGELEKLGLGGAEPSKLRRLFSSLTTAAVDWDVVLRMGNPWYDRIAAALRLPNRDDRQAAIADLEKEQRDRDNRTRAPASGAWPILAGQAVVSEQVGNLVISCLDPAIVAIAQTDNRGVMNVELVKLGCLLAAYRAENGKYPAALADLAPKYVAAVPLDLFSGKPLVYKLQEGGYVLYSVGVNGQDDGGLTAEDRESAPDGAGDYDDLVVQVPLKKREKRPDE
jgi:hypothetical protein